MTAHEWDQLFTQRGTWGRWPDTRFVEWFMRTYGNVRNPGNVSVLELGCGFGAQLRFLKDAGVDYYGVDGSRTAMREARKLVGGHHPIAPYAGRITEAELEEYDFGGPYDCIVDVCTLQHLPPGINAQVVQRALKALKPGGYLFSKWWAWHPAAYTWPEDKSTPQPLGMFEQDIPHVFPGFTRRVGLETVRRDTGYTTTHWIIEARRPLEED